MDCFTGDRLYFETHDVGTMFHMFWVNLPIISNLSEYWILSRLKRVSYCEDLQFDVELALLPAVGVKVPDRTPTGAVAPGIVKVDDARETSIELAISFPTVEVVDEIKKKPTPRLPLLENGYHCVDICLRSFPDVDKRRQHKLFIFDAVMHRPIVPKSHHSSTSILKNNMHRVGSKRKLLYVQI